MAEANLERQSNALLDHVCRVLAWGRPDGGRGLLENVWILSVTTTTSGAESVGQLRPRAPLLDVASWGGEGWGPREGTGARSAFSPPSPLPGRRAEPTSRGLCPVQFVQCKSPGACRAPLRGGGRWGRGGVLFCFLLPFTSSAWPDPRDGRPYFRHVCGQDQLALHSGAAPKPLLPASPTGG